MVNFNEPAPELLTLRSICGVESPDKIPLLSPYVPTRSAAESKPTHFTTPGRPQSVWKSPGLGGGGGALLTVTVTTTDVVLLPAASLATAASVCEPLVAV